jgi:hypothetical protein
MNTEDGFSLCLISLFRGVLYERDRSVWEALQRHEGEVRRHLQPLGLVLHLDVSEGYAFLKHRDAQPDETPLPRVVEKRQLPFLPSLLCLLLRKHLIEDDARGGNVRTFLSEDEIYGRMRVFLPDSGDEVYRDNRIAAAIRKVVDLGFLRPLEDGEKSYEVHRIIKGYVDAETVDDMLRRLEAHALQQEGKD